jgi:hypothetical protein
LLLTRIKAGYQDHFSRTRAAAHHPPGGKKADEPYAMNTNFYSAASAWPCFGNRCWKNRISRKVVEGTRHLHLYPQPRGRLFVIDRSRNPYWHELIDAKISNLHNSFTENAFAVLFKPPANETELVRVQASSA